MYMRYKSRRDEPDPEGTGVLVNVDSVGDMDIVAVWVGVVSVEVIEVEEGGGIVKVRV